MQCPRCAGSGACPDCGGQGYQECPVCAGAGQRSTPRGATYPCKACQGSGKTSCPERCSSCEGSGAITEELQKRVRDTYTVRFVNFGPSGQVTRRVVAACVALFVAGMIWPGLKSSLLLSPQAIDQGRYWELFTYAWVHGSLWHLALNMGFLWTYGPILEGILGRGRFLAFFLSTAALAGGVSWVMHHWTLGAFPGTLGASGSLFAIDGAFLALYARWRLVPWEAVRSLTTWAGLWLLGGFAAAQAGWLQLDNWAHVGGFLAGILWVLVTPRPQGH